jgi:hypothetical protein
MSQKAQAHITMLYNWNEITNNHLNLYEQLLNVPYQLVENNQVLAKAD